MADTKAETPKKRPDAYHVVRRPMITEKTTFQSERHNTYTFEVSPQADKIAIKTAVEELFGVRVVDVRTANRKGKTRRYRNKMGKTKDWKRAVVQLHEDDRIDFY